MGAFTSPCCKSGMSLDTVQARSGQLAGEAGVGVVVGFTACCPPHNLAAAVNSNIPWM